MRELEFLPAWYPELHRKRRLLRLEVWGTVVVAGSLVAWLCLVNSNRLNAQGELGNLHAQMVQTDKQLDQISHLQALKAQLQQQEQVQAKLGVHIESVRLINKLAALMPPSMSLTELSFETEEIATAPAGGLAAAANNAAPPQRRLRADIKGLAPNDVDVANFITELTRVPFFDHVSMTYVKDHRDDKYVSREFDIAFTVDLSLPSGI